MVMGEVSANLKCPLCNKQMVHRFRPFCSDKCKKIDLGNWLLEKYKIPSEQEENEDTKK